ncbi:phosphatidylinositol-glycan biosynthesis class X protein [Citrus clementina]|nr:phosphatidylinositol-glycan biosynthesis class X protein [Citrus x clementina]XP_024047805.1 phosphatidylinositol-glycan biosynthesis class X protein [Citrus x clementina]XP_024047806.1 phosphatidylinositol-glycan biosynthesis class X protein [Citrus x clementina]XP_024047807.1 phosphatidylinositol-glycan biosynthesis class X protein [Citrus x clementina]XP_024047808.1 phosphatidylinositol-glycan biosynthesis class X protein [Citrus x clementina]
MLWKTFVVMCTEYLAFFRYCMESQHVRLCIYYKVAILLMFFSAIGVQVGRCEANSDVNYNIKAFSSSKKYLMTSYFGKYEKLRDSNFEEFIANELRTSFCEVLPDNTSSVIRRSVLLRHLIGEGSHRNLLSSMRFYVDPKSLSRPPFHKCELIVIERLPSGIFADPFELQHLHQRGVLTDVAVFGDTNLELPSFRSNRSAVEIHMNVGSNRLLSQKDGLEIKVQLPLHARYQPLDESGYSQVELGDPDLFLRCCIEGKLQNQSCLFISTSENAERKTGRAVWRIPSGIKSHGGFVSVVTFVSAFISTILIVLTSFFCSDFKTCNKLKCS